MNFGDFVINIKYYIENKKSSKFNFNIKNLSMYTMIKYNFHMNFTNNI